MLIFPVHELMDERKCYDYWASATVDQVVCCFWYTFRKLTILIEDCDWQIRALLAIEPERQMCYTKLIGHLALYQRGRSSGVVEG
jgi:hypothetical protein